MNNLNSAQRSYLTSESHSLNPVVMVGSQGLTEGVSSAIDKALTDHQLIKVKFQDFKEGRKEIARTMAIENHAQLVRVIGNIAILYRPAKKGDEQLYKLPN